MQTRSVVAIAAIALCTSFAAHAGTPTLHNLTPDGASIAAGNDACPDQPYYLYSGGNPDAYAPLADSAYPSPNLWAFIPHNRPTVGYDTAMVDYRFGDSFNLQNTRTVCYAVIQFRAKSTNGGSGNDGLTFGHVDNNAQFAIVGQVINPTATPGIQSYALDATGRMLLSTQTGGFGPHTPLDSVFDFYLQDDTELDFFRMYVWYGPNCAQNGSC